MSTQVDHSAAGQALGYLYQFDRATYRLLCAAVDVVAVGVEDIDDVSEHRSNGTELREQDKSTVSKGNPLTDKSVNLWKTLAMWVDAMHQSPDLLGKTEFCLVTNGTVGATSLARQIHEATSLSSADKVTDTVLGLIPSLRKDLAEFGAIVSSRGKGILARVIEKTSVYDGVSPKFGGALDDIPGLRWYAPPVRVEIFDRATGWVRRRIRECVTAGDPPRVLREDFDREMRAIIRRVNVAPLVALVKPLTPDYPQYTSQGFVKQLEWIDSDEGEVRDAIVQYVTAEAARIKWTDADLVSEEALKAYEEDLLLRWRLVRKQVSRNTWPSETREGQECYDRTMSIETHLDHQLMPKAITCGTLHLLADFSAAGQPPKLGWHPKFSERAVSEHRGQE